MSGVNKDIEFIFKYLVGNCSFFIEITYLNNSWEVFDDNLSPILFERYFCEYYLELMNKNVFKWKKISKEELTQNICVNHLKNLTKKNIDDKL